MKLKKALSILLAFVMSFSTLSVAFAANEESNVTNIYTVEDLNKIRDDLTGSYVLMNDIDLSGEEWIPIGTEQSPFKGQFDGNNNSITGLKINSIVECAYKSATGLFAFATAATIKNLSVDADIQISEAKDNFYSVGIIVGYAKFSNIENCVASGSVKADLGGACCAGGVVGEVIHDSLISSCENSADITVNAKSEIYAGGIAGSSYSPVSLCANKGTLTVENSNSDEQLKDTIYVGGIIGCMFMAEIENCYNTGDIRMGVLSKTACAGGIGGGTFSVSNCYNIGEISYTNQIATEYTAGIAGDVIYNFNGVGISENKESKVTNCYCLDNNAKELGYIDASKVENTKILTENEMKNKSSYVGFDFENVWMMGEDGYPTFGSESEKEDSEPSTDPEPSLDPEYDVVSAQIVYVPIEKRIIFGFGMPALPDGIIMKLTYSDGSSKAAQVEETDDGYYIDGQRISGGFRTSNVEYGILTTELFLNDGSLKVEYKYLVIPPIFSIIQKVFMNW